MTRKETIKLVENNPGTFTVNTTGNTPDRMELEEKIYQEHGIEVDCINEEPPVTIGEVEYKNCKILSVSLEDWVLEKYSD